MAGSVSVDDAEVAIACPVAAVRAGLALVPEDRKHHGLFLSASVAENISMAIVSRLSQLGWINVQKERTSVASLVAKLRVKVARTTQPVDALSGGNQQKVVLAKWLAREPKVLLLDEPTKGIDVGARDEIYRLMEEMAERGMAVLFVSSELEELMTMADRVLVMHERAARGRVVTFGTHGGIDHATGDARRGADAMTNPTERKKVLGILGLLIAVFVLTAFQIVLTSSPPTILQNIIRWTALFGILSLGVSFVIITGGIDLSIGSLVGLVGCLLPTPIARLRSFGKSCGHGSARLLRLHRSVPRTLSHQAKASAVRGDLVRSAPLSRFRSLLDQ